MLSFAEKRQAQKSVVDQNKILTSNPSFSEKRQSQKIKSEALALLGKISVKQSTEDSETEKTELASNGGEIDNSDFGLKASGIKTREKINAQVASITDQIRAGRDPKTLTTDE
jgi:carbamoylphosphate synthase small subunit